MHASWRDCAASWPRSLTLRDRFVRRERLALALGEVVLAQALPLPTLIALLIVRTPGPWGALATSLAAGLVIARLGVLAGMRRAYVDPSPLYWLSPLADLAAAALLVRSALRRTHTWRGRTLAARRRMRTAWTLTALHVLALVAGLFGILVAIPHPELWAGQPLAAAVYAFALQKTGGASMALGALAMLAYGVAALGVRRTALFFVAATAISACAELTGTKTGWPFGGYEYTDFLGPKLLGRVPVAVPLSWFTWASPRSCSRRRSSRSARGATARRGRSCSRRGC